jgi:hypothetical protein
MRLLLSVALAMTGVACSFYAPTIGDCTVSCGEGGACPSGFTCRGTFCRPSSGAAEDCACRAGTTQPCGVDVGECEFGQQVCSSSGAWGACDGGRGPTAEVCDGKDNDCDGLTDVGPVKVLLDGNSGPFDYHWRLHGHDGGYVLVSPLTQLDGGAEVRALRFAPDFTPQGQSGLITTGTRRVDVAAEGDTLFVGYSINSTDVELSQVSGAGQVTVLGQIPDAGYNARMQVGLGPRGLVTTWVSLDATVRVAKWPRDGGSPELHDLPPLANGTIYWVDSTTDAQYAVIEANANDGGLIDAVQDIDELAPRTTAAPYWLAERFRTRGTQVVHVDILDFPGEGEKVIFWYDYLTQTPTQYLELEQGGAWNDSDFIFDDNGDVIATWVDEPAQRVVVARVEGNTSSTLQITRAVLPADILVPAGSSSGNVALAKVPGDEMFGIVWATRAKVYGRRFCAP